MLKAARWTVTGGVVVYILYELSGYSWYEIRRALPTNPLFYLLGVVMYFLLPTTELIAYRITWKFDLLQGFFATIKKRIYNREVLDYSGEVYFVSWARQNCNLTDREAIETVRDNNVISSVTGTAVAVVLLLVFASAGQIGILQWVSREQVYVVIAVAALIAVAAGSRYRRFLFTMKLPIALTIGGVHVVRILLANALQIVQWSIAMPGVSVRVWFTYCALSLVINRIPFIPSRDIVFMGTSMPLTKLMGLSSASVASMLLMQAVLEKVLSLLLFGLAAMWPRQAPAPQVEMRN